jgi:DNA-directed RNA polymerase III subunit RPC1
MSSFAASRLEAADNADSPEARKRLVKGDVRPKRVSHLQFCFFSPAEMQRMAEFQVSSRELFTMPSRQPARGGCLDPRLGVSDKVSSCETCKRKLVDCAGHYGYIKLALPVFHIGFLRHTLHLLQCICKTCSRVLLPESERLLHLRRMRNPKTDILAKSALFKKLVDKTKKVRNCPYCNATNGTVKKVTGAPTLKIVHERLKFKKAEEDREIFRDSLEAAMKYNKDIAAIINAPTPPVEELLPTVVLDLFNRITDDDCEVLWLDPLIGRPENLILQKLLVPPVPIRPSVAMDVGGGSNEDDLTVKLQEIIDVNVALELALSKGPLTRTIIEEWDFLQIQVAQYINGELPGMQRPMGSKPMRG